MNYPQPQPRSRHNGFKIVAILTAAAFAVTLAAITANRLSNDALAVLAGVACGVGAAIPTSLLILAVTRRNQRTEPDTTMHVPRPPTTQPTIMVIPPMAMPQPTLPATWQTGPVQRKFTVVGEE